MIIKSHGIKIELIASVIVYADRIKFRQVLQNIISNSIKFRSTERPLNIEIGYKPNETNHIISSIDNGIGISDDYKSTVFKELTQLNLKEYDCTGKGLSIVRNIVDRHYGKVNLESNILYGLKVEILLPM